MLYKHSLGCQTQNPILFKLQIGRHCQIRCLSCPGSHTEEAVEPEPGCGP